MLWIATPAKTERRPALTKIQGVNPITSNADGKLVMSYHRIQFRKITPGLVLVAAILVMSGPRVHAKTITLSCKFCAGCGNTPIAIDLDQGLVTEYWSQFDGGTAKWKATISTAHIEWTNSNRVTHSLDRFSGDIESVTPGLNDNLPYPGHCSAATPLGAE